MPKIEYNNQIIDYTFIQKRGLKSYYIRIEKNKKVILKGHPIAEEEANKIILRKAKWILKKMDLIQSVETNSILAERKVQYLGEEYLIELKKSDDFKRVNIKFHLGKCIIYYSQHTEEQLQSAITLFLRQKAIEVISIRAQEWSQQMRLSYKELKFRKLKRRWGSCSFDNIITINISAIQLPLYLIDYLIIHELSHIKVKNHSKDFWREVKKYSPNWKELDTEIKHIHI